MNVSDVTSVTLEGACAALLLAAAYKLYKMRITSESECCDGHFRYATANRGGSNNDLQLSDRASRDMEAGMTKL